MKPEPLKKKMVAESSFKTISFGLREIVILRCLQRYTTKKNKIKRRISKEMADIENI